jgi:hypothetical protein
LNLVVGILENDIAEFDLNVGTRIFKLCLVDEELEWVEVVADFVDDVCVR